MRLQNEIEMFANWVNGITFEQFVELYGHMGFTGRGYIKEKWRNFQDNALNWYSDLDISNRYIVYNRVTNQE